MIYSEFSMVITIFVTHMSYGKLVPPWYTTAGQCIVAAGDTAIRSARTMSSVTAGHAGGDPSL